MASPHPIIFLYVSTFVRKDAEFLLETHKHNKDIYYKWIKELHLTDFISEVVEVEEEVYGLRIGDQTKKRPYLSFDRVSYDNLQQIIGILS